MHTQQDTGVTNAPVDAKGDVQDGVTGATVGARSGRGDGACAWPCPSKAMEERVAALQRYVTSFRCVEAAGHPGRAWQVPVSHARTACMHLVVPPQVPGVWVHVTHCSTLHQLLPAYGQRAGTRAHHILLCSLPARVSRSAACDPTASDAVCGVIRRSRRPTSPSSVLKPCSWRRS